MLLEERLNHIINQYVIPWGIHILIALLIFLVGRIAAKWISQAVGRALSRTRLDATLTSFLQSILQVFLLLIVIVAALDQLGVNTTSLVAMLGAAGLAIGLALQNSLQNFAAGFMLLIFRPFKSGDFVEAGGTSGTVEKINIFSTMLRTGDNKVVIVPNGVIYSGNITNYNARPTRRIDMVFGIGYNDSIKNARDIIAQQIAADPRILEEPATVIAVSELAANSVNLVVRPWVKTDDFWSVKFDLTEKIKVAFDEGGISIPFPQMDIHWSQPLTGKPQTTEKDSARPEADDEEELPLR